ncbi:glycosyltransferase family 4 protein [Rufibacter immobilis]|uniref:glycosyltransferase family 4 protein n=1 Tax=Rufibacter immobilis TaxID=1348778 RepID=UPI0035EC1FBD
MKVYKRKVLHIIDNLGVGGAEKLLVNTINDLADYQHVVVLLNEPEDLKHELPSSVSYYKLNFTTDRRLLVKLIQFGNLIQLRKIVSDEKPHVVHAHLFWSTFYARLVCPPNASLFFTIHGMIGDRVFRSSYLYRKLERISISSKQYLIAVSESVLNNYLEYIPFQGPSKVVYNYIPDQYFYNQKRTYLLSGLQFKIISVGNLKPVKNYDVQIKAMALLGSKFQLDIYGSGEMESHLKGIIQELGIDNVRLMGTADNMNEILSAYDLAVMSSFSEGHSIALNEAMALGLPVILSDIASFRESTNNKAVYFNPTDASELACKIKELYFNNAAREELGILNRALAEKYVKKESYLNSLRSLYDFVSRK